MKFYKLFITSLVLLTGCKNQNPTVYGAAQQDAPLERIEYERPAPVEGQRPSDQAIPQDVRVERPAPPPAPELGERITQTDSEIFKPKVDILFVTDTSRSMQPHQAKLRANINQFSQNFLRKKDFLDFHIGVVAPWDAINFKGLDKPCFQGELRPLGGMRSGENYQNCAPLRSSDQISFVTNSTHSDESQLNSILANTLSIGVEKFEVNNPQISGPEHEQLFSPVIAALKPENNVAEGMNKGFRRSDAHLAVVFLTDTDDFNFLTITQDAETLSNETTKNKLLTFAQNTDQWILDRLEISAAEMSNYLLSLKRENVSVSVYAATARYNQLRNNNLNREFQAADYYIQAPGRGPRKIVQLLDRMQGIGFDLNEDNFGSKLSEFGNDIVAKSLRRTIILRHKPNIADPRYIVVKYGSQIIAEDKTPQDDNPAGWYYDVQGAIESGIHRIIVGENTQFRLEQNARFSVEYTPIITDTRTTGPQ